jgi:hypothetical protein
VTDRSRDDDSEYRDAVQRAERATRFGWAAIAGTTGMLGCVLVVMAVVCAVAVVAGLYVVVSMDH